MPTPSYHIAIIGAGAAGLAAAIFAAEEAERLGVRLRIALLDGAKKPGAKILVSGGGRCNVTNTQVTPGDYCGGSQKIIRNVLRSFNELHTLQWMESLGIPLKLESTGKYFPESNSARSVLEALMRRIDELGIEKLFGYRVSTVSLSHPASTPWERRRPAGFFSNDMQGATSLQNSSPPQASHFSQSPLWQITNVADNTTITARRLIIATGGRALPKSGSDGAAYPWLRQLGHTVITPVPALAPLVLDERGMPDSPLSTAFADLSGITIDARLEFVVDNRSMGHFTGSLLFTHFGLSGPAPMNLSRHIARHRQAHPKADPGQLRLGHPKFPDAAKADAWLQDRAKDNPRATPASIINRLFPERIASILASAVEADRISSLTRADRLHLARLLAESPLAVKGDRGYSFAEATAGGVALEEINWRTMASRKADDLYLCGEVLDVDGRIGGFNFQWAWSTGHQAGQAAARSAALEMKT